MKNTSILLSMMILLLGCNSIGSDNIQSSPSIQSIAENTEEILGMQCLVDVTSDYDRKGEMYRLGSKDQRYIKINRKEGSKPEYFFMKDGIKSKTYNYIGGTVFSEKLNEHSFIAPVKVGSEGTDYVIVINGKESKLLRGSMMSNLEYRDDSKILRFVLSLGDEKHKIYDCYTDIKDYNEFINRQNNTLIISDQQLLEIFTLSKEGKRGVGGRYMPIVSSDNVLLYDILYQIKQSYFFGKIYFVMEGYDKGDEDIFKQYYYYLDYFKKKGYGKFTKEGNEEVLQKTNIKDYDSYFSINTSMNIRNSIAEGAGSNVRISN